METMMKSMSGFAIDEEAVDAEMPSDEEICKRSVEDYMTMENKRPVSARRGVNPTIETDVMDSEVQEFNHDLRDLSPDRVEVRSRAGSRARFDQD